MFEGVRDLLSVLRLAQNEDESRTLRHQLNSDPKSVRHLISAADKYMLLSATLHALSQRFGLLPDAADAHNGVALQLVAAAGRLTARQKKIEEGLISVVRSLNQAHIVPMLLKGSACLWTGEPPWRYQRDIDILVKPAEAEACQSVLEAAGFYPMPGQDPAPHHMQPLMHDDLPVGIEVHFAVSNPRAESYLPSNEFWQHAVSLDDGRGTVMLPGPVQHLLHMVVHSHFGHRNSVYGVAPLKGIYEFAWTIKNAPSETVRAMHDRASCNPRLLAALDLWFAAAQAELGVTSPGMPPVATDAVARWAQLMERTLDHKLPSLITAFNEEHNMIRARSRGLDALKHALFAPLMDIISAPIWIDRNEQALKSAGIAEV